MNGDVSRRSFLKTVGIGAAALAVGDRLVNASRVLAAPQWSSVGSPAAGQIGGVDVDPQMQAVLDEFLNFHQPPFYSLVPRVAREEYPITEAARAVLSKQSLPSVQPVGYISHQVIHGPGGQLLLRMYAPASTGSFPVILYFHGGGWVIGTLNSYDPTPRALVNATGAMVVSVAYRNAPEFPFPGAPQDAMAAYQWVLANIGSFGGDASKVAVAGESAGGNLATVLCMMARDQGVKLPLHQLLVYPVTSTFYGTPEMNFGSYQQFTDAVPLATPGLAWFYKFYLRNAADALNPYASPLRGNLSGLPPATVITAEIDPLRDEGEEYKNKLAAAGVTVTGQRYTGVTHEFFSLSGAVDKAKQAVADAAADLKRSFGTA